MRQREERVDVTQRGLHRQRIPQNSGVRCDSDEAQKHRPKDVGDCGSSSDRCYERRALFMTRVALVYRIKQDVGVERGAHSRSRICCTDSLSSRSTRAPNSRVVHTKSGLGVGGCARTGAKSSETSDPSVLPSAWLRALRSARISGSRSTVVLIHLMLLPTTSDAPATGAGQLRLADRSAARPALTARWTSTCVAPLESRGS